MDRPMNGGLHVGLIMDGNGRWDANVATAA